MPRPTVFISSTASGFGDLRQALSYVLDQRGFDVLAFEEAAFPVSGDRRALEECLAIVQSADYYLLLIGDAAGRVEAGTSPTREEYRAAKAGFLNDGRPRLVLTVRSRTRDAVDRWKNDGTIDGIDKPEFISEFISEVEGDSEEDAPNWLHRFKDFRELVEILVTRLRLGRDLDATLRRKAVLDELLDNLAAMTSRSGESAFPHHWWGLRARDQIQLTSADIGTDLRVSRAIASSLGGCFVAGHLGALSTAAMEQTVLAGTFLEYSTADQRFVASDLHNSLVGVIDDIKRAKGTLETSNDWRLNLMSAASKANRLKAAVNVRTEDVVWALAYVDRAEDAFQSQTALARYLLGKSETPVPDAKLRRPLSPIKDSVEGLWRESVQRQDVEHLIVTELHPFGPRIPADLFPDTHRDAFAAELAARVRPQLEAILSERGPEMLHLVSELDQLSQDAALETISRMTASHGEGIENRDRQAPSHREQAEDD